jgi:uncharacterized membrane protein
MHGTAQRVFVFALALWVGSLITIGYIVAPALFITLEDPQAAGAVAGGLFYVESTISLVTGVLLLVLANLLVKRGLNRYRAVRWFLLVMLLAAAGNAFITQPMMDALRQEAIELGLAVMQSPMAQSFKRLHGVSSVLYLLQSLFGLAILWRVSKPIDTD